MGQNEHDDGEGILCRFEAVQVTAGRQPTKDLEGGAELQIVDKHIYVGSKYKTTWKRLESVAVDHNDRTLKLVSDQYEVNAAYPHLVQWPKFIRSLEKRWNKRLRKAQRREEEEKAAQNQNKPSHRRYQRTYGQSNRRSKASDFLLRNAKNIEDWGSDDDEVFNRLTPKELAKKRNGQPEQERVHDDDFEENDNEGDVTMDDVMEDKPTISGDEASDSASVVPALQDEKMDSESLQEPVKAKGLRRLKRKRKSKSDCTETESDDDDDLFNAPDITTPAAKRIVSPGTALRAGVLEDDDDDEPEEQEKLNEQKPSETVNEQDETAHSSPVHQTKSSPISRFFAPRRPQPPISGDPSKESTSPKKPESEPSNTEQAKDKKIMSNFFVPRARPFSSATTEAECPDHKQDKATAVTSPPQGGTQDRQKRSATKYSTPPRSTPQNNRKVSNAESGSALEHADDPIVDFDEDHATTPNRDQSSKGRRLGPKRLFKAGATYGRARASTAMVALDIADNTQGTRSPFHSVKSTPDRLVTTSPSSSVATTILSPKKICTPKWRGLRNLGNTCYMNASLQMLYTVPAFVEALGPIRAGRRLTQQIYSLWQDLQVNPSEENVRTATAKGIKLAVDDRTEHFRGYQQRDAHEFLGELVDQIHEDLEEAPAKTESKSPGASNTKDDKEDTKDNVVSPQPAESLDKTKQGLPTDDFFRLNVEVCLQCKSCQYSRTKEEMYRCLSLDIGRDGVGPASVEQCLENFFKPVELEIKCEKCSSGTVATQTMRVLSRPKSLFVHLKRFVVVTTPRKGATEATMEMSFQKDKTPVELTENLSLDRYLKSDDDMSGDKPTYQLKSVVHHIGSTADSGHYTADALRTRTPEEGETSLAEHAWVSFDDGITSERTFKEVQSSLENQQTAYMLLYSIA